MFFDTVELTGFVQYIERFFSIYCTCCEWHLVDLSYSVDHNFDKRTISKRKISVISCSTLCSALVIVQLMKLFSKYATRNCCTLRTHFMSASSILFSHYII